MHYYPKRKKNESWDMFIVRTKKNERKNKVMSPLEKQVGGSHYKDCKIQPVEYIANNNLDFFEGNIVKYITRHRTKGEGKKDIEKVIHYAELILKLFYNKQDSQIWENKYEEKYNGPTD